MKILSILTLFFIISCDGGAKKSSGKQPPGLPETIKLGETTAKELDKELGSPKDSYEMDAATVSTYKDGSAAKIENEVVKSFYRDPVGDELKLQYWLQLWKDKVTTTEKIESTKNEHGTYEYQLINKNDNTTIIFDHESGIVKRVMHYEN